MRKLIAILLLSVYMASATELHQLLKLPALVTHFVHHRQEDARMSFWNFLCLHYANGDKRDADYDEDMKLPFKSHDSCPNPSSFVTVLPSDPLIELQPQRPEYGDPDGHFPTCDEQFVSSAYLSAIWQPPRLS